MNVKHSTSFQFAGKPVYCSYCPKESLRPAKPLTIAQPVTGAACRPNAACWNAPAGTRTARIVGGRGPPGCVSPTRHRLPLRSGVLIESAKRRDELNAAVVRFDIDDDLAVMQARRRQSRRRAAANLLIVAPNAGMRARGRREARRRRAQRPRAWFFVYAVACRSLLATHRAPNWHDTCPLVGGPSTPRPSCVRCATRRQLDPVQPRRRPGAV